MIDCDYVKNHEISYCTFEHHPCEKELYGVCPYDLDNEDTAVSEIYKGICPEDIIRTGEEDGI